MNRLRGSAGLLALVAVVVCCGPALAQPCCGPITSEGARLAASLDATGVDHLWAAGFRHHPGAWDPGGGDVIRYYAHPVDWDRVGG